MIRVGIIGPADREEMIRLSIRLAERSAEGVILDSRRDPAICMTAHGESACDIELKDFNAFYVADLGLPSPMVRQENGKLDRAASIRALASSRRRLTAWNALLHRLSMRCPVVNPPHTHDLHALKPWEMAVYSRLDLPAPSTFCTSDAIALADLPGDAEGGWIRKGMVGGYGYTEAFEIPETVEASAKILEQGALMIQERIEGDNLRAFVLNGEVIGAAEIIASAGGATDSRRGETRMRRVDLPEEAARAATTAAGHWGMAFAAVDFMFDSKSGRHLLLECNSAPFFAVFEKRTGLPISGRLADFLVGR